jgi:hypothetical protein
MARMEIDRARFLALASAMSAACGGAAKHAAPIEAPAPAAPSASARPLGAPPPVSSAAPKPRRPGLWGYRPLEPARTCAAVKCFRGAPIDEGSGAFDGRECRHLEQGLRPDAFQRVMACVLEPDADSPCDVPLFLAEPGGCLEKWAEPPELDPATAAKCKPIVARCNGPARSSFAGSGALTMDQCQGVLSVTRPAMHPRMIHCITEYCDDAPNVCYQELLR